MSFYGTKQIWNPFFADKKNATFSLILSKTLF